MRDGRFVNGGIIGSRGFAGEMAGRHALCFGLVAVKVRHYVLGMVKTYATQGRRSAPAKESRIKERSVLIEGSPHFSKGFSLGLSPDFSIIGSTAAYRRCVGIPEVQI